MLCRYKLKLNPKFVLHFLAHPKAMFWDTCDWERMLTGRRFAAHCPFGHTNRVNMVFHHAEACRDLGHVQPLSLPSALSLERTSRDHAHLAFGSYVLWSVVSALGAILFIKSRQESRMSSGTEWVIWCRWHTGAAITLGIWWGGDEDDQELSYCYIHTYEINLNAMLLASV